MDKVFSTKLNDKVLKKLDVFCKRHHLKKSQFLASIIEEALERKKAVFELAESLSRGLEDEKAGELYTIKEVERRVFKKTG